MDKRTELADRYSSDLLFADGFDDAIIGVCCGHDSERVAYSTQKMFTICVRTMGMTTEEAWEYLEFNTFGAYVGNNTPVYVEGLS